MVLTVPYDAVGSILDELGPSIADKIVVDVTNRFDPAHLDETSNAEVIQARASGARKATDG